MKGRKPDQNAIRRGQSDSYGKTELVEAVGLAMPVDIAADPMKSQIWNWICPPTNSFTEQDLPLLRELCYWHVVFTRAQESMIGEDGSIEVLVDMGTIQHSDGTIGKKLVEHEALKIIKHASGEIRALSDLLGLSPLARSRIGLINATTVKTAADTAAMFRSIDGAYGLPDA